MAETQPMMLQELCYTAADFRLQLASIVCDEGVADVVDGSLLVTTGGSGLDLFVAEGAAFIDSDVDDQGMYSVFNDDTVTVTATTADGTNPRIDQVIATVNDSQIVGTDDDWVLSVLAGTPTVGATLANLTGAAALPDRSIRLAYVLVPATFAGPFVNATHILDARSSFVACGEPELPSTKWTRSTNQSLTTGTPTTITFPAGATGSTVPNLYFSESSGTITFTRAGLYMVNGTVTFAANTDSNERFTRILRNGATSEAFQAGPAVNSASVNTNQSVSAYINVAVNDTIVLQSRQQSGGNLNVAAASLTVTRVGVVA